MTCAALDAIASLGSPRSGKTARWTAAPMAYARQRSNASTTRPRLGTSKNSDVSLSGTHFVQKRHARFHFPEKKAFGPSFSAQDPSFHSLAGLPWSHSLQGRGAPIGEVPTDGWTGAGRPYARYPVRIGAMTNDALTDIAEP